MSVVGKFVSMEFSFGPGQGIVLANRGVLNNSWGKFPHKLMPGRACVLVDQDLSLKMGAHIPARKLNSKLRPHIRYFRREGLTQVESIPSTSKLVNLVRHLGVMTTSAFEYDGRLFEPGWFGKILELAASPEQPYLIYWHKVGGMGTFNWEMPFLPEHMVFVDPVTNFQFSPPPPGSEKYARGDLTVVTSLERSVPGPAGMSLVWSARCMQTSNAVSLSEGDVLQCEDPKQGSFRVLMGRAKGKVVHPRGCPMNSFPHSLFLIGQQVRVDRENFKFRNRELHNLCGEVLLGTDVEGDVGVQFDEDLGAGSLDGIGDDGKCLFVPAACLKENSG